MPAEPLARRDTQLPRDEVEPGDELGHPMLDLEAGVHLQEIVAAVRVEEELHRRRVVEVDRPGARSALSKSASRIAGVTRGRRRLLDQLLVPALDRAVPLAERHEVAMAVAEQLDLHVPRGRTSRST